ncbi:hypothetical protein [Polaribacter sp.]|uniref:hypothetical protein n=1 Tax=Polaribacter sp. TaxID=1920175 RepID=UPI0040486853
MNKEIHKCVQENYKEFSGGEFNLYEEFTSIENLLLKENILSNKSKVGYKEALSELFNSTKTSQKYITVYNKISYDKEHSRMLFFSGTLAIPFSCVGKYLEENNLDKSDNYSKYYEILKKAYQDFTPDNPQLYYDLIDLTPNNKMDDIMFKAPIISILIGVLNYNVNLEELK